MTILVMSPVWAGLAACRASAARELRAHPVQHRARSHLRHAESRHARSEFAVVGAEGGHRRRQQVEHEERGNRADIQPGNGWDDATEEVEVHVRHGENGTEEGHALRLREPGEQDAQGQDAAVEAQEAAARAGASTSAASGDNEHNVLSKRYPCCRNSPRGYQGDTKGAPRGHQGGTKGTPRGQQGGSKGTAGGQQRDSKETARGQQGDSKGTTWSKDDG